MEAEVGHPAARSRRSESGAWIPVALLAPGLVLLAGAFVAPLGVLLARSLADPDPTLRNYARAATPENLQIFGNSIEIALLSTLTTILIAYPLAALITFAPPLPRRLLTLCVVLPLWTNILARCYAWMLILQNRGAINLLVTDVLGLRSTPFALIFNRTAVVIGMTHYLVPIATLVLLNTMRGVDRRFLAAAASLGARPARVLFKVFMPLTATGIRAAVLLTFILALGFFVTPALLGGRQDTTIAMLIDQAFNELLDWGLGSALAMVLLAATLVGITAYQRLSSGLR